MALQWTHRRRPFRPSGRLRGGATGVRGGQVWHTASREERAACNTVIEQCSKCEQPSTTTAMASDRFHKWVLRVCILSFVPLYLCFDQCMCALFSLLCEIVIHDYIYENLQCHAFYDLRQKIRQFNFSFLQLLNFGTFFEMLSATRFFHFNFIILRLMLAQHKITVVKIIKISFFTSKFETLAIHNSPLIKGEQSGMKNFVFKSYCVNYGDSGDPFR
jgi:hypothetical protein